ncbi:MAG: hypothetical protein EA370_06095 [Wenzhouxiangella sp.]|nr:MAG: hypothetical protein EA370_06095 [Wenzhouxiangella sp.]
MHNHLAALCALMLVVGLETAAGELSEPEFNGTHSAPLPTTETTWVRVPAAGNEHLQAHPEALDYGRFLWVPYSALEQDRGFGSIRQLDSDTVVRDGFFELDLGGLRFDPLADGPPHSLLTSHWQRSSQPDWRLVQFRGPVRQAWLDQLASVGVEPVQYIYPHAYVVWADPAAMNRASLLANVRWQGEFLPDYRLAPRFRRQGNQRIEANVIMRRDYGSLRDTLDLADAELISAGPMDRHFDVVDVWIDEHRLVDLAGMPGVFSVQPVATDGGTRSEMSVQINHDNVDGGGLALTGYQAFLTELGLDGSGVIMACVDNGVQANHPDLSRRMLPCSGPSCGNGQETDGHGTHVAGIMAGDAASGTANGGGFLRGQGMAPGAEIVDQRTSNFGAPWLLNLMRESVRNAAVISNNSWGPSGSPLGYDNNTRQADIGVRDADIDEPGDQPLTYVLAIMNGFGGTSSQGTPDEAKNLFTIGSTWAQVNADTQDMRNDQIGANSAHGPALDGRFIPHMVAASRFTDSTLGSSGYGLQGGTSQAAPHVAGAVALFTEYYRNLFEVDPSPALVKAAFLPVTRDLEGNNDANNNSIGARPDAKQGWGRMMTKPVLDPEQAVVYVDQTHVFSETGQTWQATYFADDPTQPMRLMLVWTDAPGHGLGGSTPAWNNDLDLRVQVGDELYLGNVFVDGWSSTGGSADHRNNTEAVFLTADQHLGSIEVEVLAADINSNALPNAGDQSSQDFALVCYNCRSTPDEADLAIGMTAVPTPVLAGQTLTWVLQATNFGPSDSATVSVALELPAEVEFSQHRTLPSGVPGSWHCNYSSGTVNCQWPDGLSAATMAPALEISADVDAHTPNGYLDSHAQISGESSDPNPGNNSASLSTRVLTDLDQVFFDDFESSD